MGACAAAANARAAAASKEREAEAARAESELRALRESGEQAARPPERHVYGRVSSEVMRGICLLRAGGRGIRIKPSVCCIEFFY